MSCTQCESVVERPDIPHVLRTCAGCGRELRVHPPGPHGIGMQVSKGDRVVLPASAMAMSLNPLKTRMRFSRYGMQWFAGQLHLGDLHTKRNNPFDELDGLYRRAEHILSNSPLLAGVELGTEEGANEAVERLQKNQETVEWWAYLMGSFISILRDAIDANNLQDAVWANACLERCRAMLLFKEQLEEVVWMGQSAQKIIQILQTWYGNKTNDDEGFWQITLKENAYAISQVFAVPVVLIKDAAYVGGMNVDRQNAKLVDYLFSLESSRDAALVEIKAPVTALLGKKYRGTYAPSVELSGAIMQVLDYRRSFAKNLPSILEDTTHKVTAFAPRCVVIIGNCASQLDTPEKRAAFELFRANSKDVETVTYDELFRKLEILASLFSLTASEKNPEDPAQPGPT